MRIAFGFDLHNTILESNTAWLNSLMLHGGKNTDKSYIELLIYNKVSRKKIAANIGANYADVLRDYHRFVGVNDKMVTLVRELYSRYPLYLISSSSNEKVMKDLESWNGKQYFAGIYTRENFSKEKNEDWDSLLDNLNIDLMIYIGNDVEEDVIDCKRVISLVNGDFLKKLAELDILSKRGMSID